MDTVGVDIASTVEVVDVTFPVGPVADTGVMAAQHTRAGAELLDVAARAQ